MTQGNLGEIDRARCVTTALARVGDKWTIMIVTQLEPEPMRFSALLRAVSGISSKMLAITLRALERDGFVLRTVHVTKPPSVEYALTDLGKEMVIPVKALGIWVLDNFHRIEGARSRFDNETDGT